MSKYVLFNDKNISCVPQKELCISMIDEFKNLLFPHFYSCEYNEERTINNIKSILFSQLKCAYTLAKLEINVNNIVDLFIDKIPEIIDITITDLEAAYLGDPAAYDKVEIILAYPGFETILIYRIAHSLYELEVPYIPRILSEYAHGIAGIDIHPGARIGKYFFIDHGTGVVIGETTIIGDNVKIYQGVTLGALSLKDGRNLSGTKRHPTICNNVTIYSNASVLGGDTVIGEDSIIGSNVCIFNSIPRNSRIKGTN